MLLNVCFVLLFAKIAIGEACSTTTPRAIKSYTPRAIKIGEKEYLDPKYDIVAKKIFKDNDLLLKFINGAMCPDCKDPNHYKSITYVSEVQNPDTRRGKLVAFDVMCVSDTGVKIIVEVQVVKEKNFAKRSQYYVSRLITDQLLLKEPVTTQEKPPPDASVDSLTIKQSTLAHYISDEAYALLKPVHFIAILDFSLFSGEEYISNHLILDKKTHANHLNLSTYTFIELPKLKKKGYNVDKYTTFVEKMSYLFWFQYEADEYSVGLAELFKRDHNIQKAANYANRAKWSAKEEAEYRALIDNDNVYKGVMNTCREEGREEGRKEGREEGRKEGREEGLEKGYKEIAASLIQSKMLSDADIAKHTKIDVTEIAAMKKEILKEKL